MTENYLFPIDEIKLISYYKMVSGHYYLFDAQYFSVDVG